MLLYCGWRVLHKLLYYYVCIVVASTVVHTQRRRPILAPIPRSRSFAPPLRGAEQRSRQASCDRLGRYVKAQEGRKKLRAWVGRRRGAHYPPRPLHCDQDWRRERFINIINIKQAKLLGKISHVFNFQLAEETEKYVVFMLKKGHFLCCCFLS